MARRQKEQNALNGFQYKMVFLGSASLSLVSNDYEFLYDLIK